MVLEIPRRKFLRTINSKYIYGRVVGSPDDCQALASVAFCQPWHFLETDILVLIPFSSQPVVHTVIFLIEMAIIGRLVAKFNSYYADRPGIIHALEDTT
jgi:protein Mpv17